MAPGGPDLTFGIAVHEMTEGLMKHQPDPFLRYTENARTLNSTWHSTAFGLMRELETEFIPRLEQDYEIIEIEKEQEVLIAPDLVLLSRFDVVIRRKDDQMPFVLNWKTTTNMDRFRYFAEAELQATLEAISLEAILGEPCGVMLIGLDKGRKVKDKVRGTSDLRNQFSSVYTDGTEYQTARTAKKGWHREDTWPYIEQHLEWLAQHGQVGMVSEMVPILPSEERKRLIVSEVREIEQTVLDDHIRPIHNWRSCRTFMGECAYFDVCHLGLDASELFERRVPNHPGEVTK
jgi:hypothetical protein